MAQTETDYKDLARLIHKSKRCVIVTGAGISDFRSENGLYNLVKEKYPDVVVKGKDLFDATLFQRPETTRVFYSFISGLKRQIESATVTPTHKFIKNLDEKKKLLRCYTQNIDSLEQRIDLCADVSNVKECKVVQLHGDLESGYCTLCKQIYSLSQEILDTYEKGDAPTCQACVEKDRVRTAEGRRRQAIGLVRPNIVLYNEDHPQGDAIASFLTLDIKKNPDLLIIMGTSLKVVGIRRLIRDVAKVVHSRPLGKVVFINKTPATKEWSGIVDTFVLEESDKAVELITKELKKLEEKTARKPFRPVQKTTNSQDQKTLGLSPASTKEAKKQTTLSFKTVKAKKTISNSAQKAQ